MHQDMALVERFSGEKFSTNILKPANSMHFFINFVPLNQTLPFFFFFYIIRLKRVYILFTAKNGLNAFDRQMLTFLSEKLMTPRGTQPFTLQAIITKADQVRIEELQTNLSLIQKDIWESAPLCLPAIVTSTALSPPFQIDLVQKNIADACGL